VAPGAARAVYAANLTQITDLAFGPDGSLYVLQHAAGLFFQRSGLDRADRAGRLPHHRRHAGEAEPSGRPRRRA